MCAMLLDGIALSWFDRLSVAQAVLFGFCVGRVTHFPVALCLCRAAEAGSNMYVFSMACFVGSDDDRVMVCCSVVAELTTWDDNDRRRDWIGAVFSEDVVDAWLLLFFANAGDGNSGDRCMVGGGRAGVGSAFLVFDFGVGDEHFSVSSGSCLVVG